MRPARLVPVKWRLPECARTILPVPVNLKRLAAPRCVFSFFFGLVEFLGIAGISPQEFYANRTLGRLGGLLRSWLCYWSALLGRQQRDQNVAFHARHRFNLAEVADFIEQARHLGAAHFLVRHFTPAMENHGAHFVAFPEEANDLVLANLVIVLRGGRPKFDFLELRATAALALLMRLFILLVKKFAVVGDLANRRIGGGRDLHQVESLFARQTDSLERLHHPKLGTFFINHPDFARPDPLVDAGTVALPEAAFCDNSP